ncbi:MAG TPA: hypothetical protein P5136_02705 [Methanofastidiosum sp.]|nr:hypothetical protein [Methanofastidiosum sp.]
MDSVYTFGPKIELTRNFNPDTIVTASIVISGIDQDLYTGDELYLVITDNDGNVVTTC